MAATVNSAILRRRLLPWLDCRVHVPRPTDTVEGMDLQLDDRVILVVGGHGLVSTAVVECLRTERAIAIPGSRHARGGIVMDAADDSAVDRAIRGILSEHGRLDGLVVAAAPSARTLDPVRNPDPEQALAAVDCKAMNFLRVANAVLPAYASAATRGSSVSAARARSSRATSPGRCATRRSSSRESTWPMPTRERVSRSTS